VAIDQRLSSNLRYRLQFSGFQVASSGKSYQSKLKKQARWQADGQVFYQMAPTFTIALFSRYLSASAFPAFPNTRVLDKWLWDVILNKSLWSRRAYFQVVFRNLFDDEERYHPMGSRLNFRWFVQFGVNFYSD